MATKRPRFTAQFKAKTAAEALRDDRTIQASVAKYAVHPSQVSGWKRQAQADLPKLFGGESNRCIRQTDSRRSRMQESRLPIGGPTKGEARGSVSSGRDCTSVEAGENSANRLMRWVVTMCDSTRPLVKHTPLETLTSLPTGRRQTDHG